MRKQTTSVKRLTDAQRYLLQRIPGSYQMNSYKETPMPAEVKKAEALVERYRKQEARERCAADKRKEATELRKTAKLSL